MHPAFRYTKNDWPEGSLRLIEFALKSDSAGNQLQDRVLLYVPTPSPTIREGTLVTVRQEDTLEGATIHASVHFPHSAKESPKAPFQSAVRGLVRSAVVLSWEAYSQVNGYIMDSPSVPSSLHDQPLDYYGKSDMFQKLKEIEKKRGAGRGFGFQIGGHFSWESFAETMQRNFDSDHMDSHERSATYWAWTAWKRSMYDFNISLEGREVRRSNGIPAWVDSLLRRELHESKLPEIPALPQVVDYKKSVAEDKKLAASERKRIKKEVCGNCWHFPHDVFQSEDMPKRDVHAKSIESRLAQSLESIAARQHNDALQKHAADNSASLAAYELLRAAVRDGDYGFALLDKYVVSDGERAGKHLVAMESLAKKDRNPLSRKTFEAQAKNHQAELTKIQSMVHDVVGYASGRASSALRMTYAVPVEYRGRFSSEGAGDRPERVAKYHVETALRAILSVCNLPFPPGKSGGAVEQVVVADEKQPQNVVYDLSALVREFAVEDRAPLVAGRYKLERVLGVGGISVAYLATDLEAHERSSQRQVVVKVAKTDGSVEKLRENARNVAVLLGFAHESVAKVLDVRHRDDGDEPCIVLEYSPGATVGDVLRKEGKVSQSVALEIVKQTAVALKATGGLSAHLDVKEDNVYLTTEGKAKLLDFGLKSVVEENLEHTVMTAHQSVMGTAGYIAPEVKETGGDGRSDLFSLGQMLYKMLTGHLPQTPEMPSQLVEGVASGVDTLYAGLTKKNPLQRLTADDVIAHVDKLQQDKEVKDVVRVALTVVPPQIRIKADEAVPAVEPVRVEQNVAPPVLHEPVHVVEPVPIVVAPEQVVMPEPVLADVTVAPLAEVVVSARPALDKVLRGKRAVAEKNAVAVEEDERELE